MGNEEWTTAGQGTFWSPENKGDKLEGEYVESFKGKFGLGYKIKTKEGVMLTASYVVLIDRMTEVPIGSEVQIVYLGEGEASAKNRNPPKLFEVKYRPKA